MPKERMTMAIMVSRSVKPRSRLFERIEFIRSISSFNPRRTTPGVRPHAASSAHDGHGACSERLTGNANKDCAVEGRVDWIRVRSRGAEFHDGRASPYIADIDRGIVPKAHGRIGNTRLEHHL